MGVREVKRERQKERKGHKAATDCQNVRFANSESVSCSSRAASALCAANAISANPKESRYSIGILFLTVCGGKRGEKPYLLCAKLIIEVPKASLSASSRILKVLFKACLFPFDSNLLSVSGYRSSTLALGKENSIIDDKCVFAVKISKYLLYDEKLFVNSPATEKEKEKSENHFARQ